VELYVNFCNMFIHIGQIIYRLIKQKGFKAKFVAEQINVSESSLFKIYTRETIDIDKLIRLSVLLETNLFLHYTESRPLKSIFDKETAPLRLQIEQQQKSLVQKDKRIKELEDMKDTLQKMIMLMENQRSCVCRSISNKLNEPSL